MDKAEVALQLAAMERRPMTHGGAPPKSTPDADAQLCAEVLYKVAHAIDYTERAKQRVAV